MKSFSRGIIFNYLIFFTAVMTGQILHEDVFKDFHGEILEEKLIEHFTPDSIYDYNIVRDTLFLKIDAIDRKLSCIYSGHTLTIPEGSDPTQAVFMNGVADGINTEHVFPQSFFTDDSYPVRDMHHLYPSRVKINSDRGNHPFGESQDNLTDKWYRNNEELNSKPSINIDEYSELYLSSIENLFEPRENVKGDIARSMFYIYTFYSKTLLAKQPDTDIFFETQRNTLCDWHFADPVDEKEWNRNLKISSYQGKYNPFILDCTVAQRLYCQDYIEPCIMVNTDEPIDINHEYINYDINKGIINVDQITDAKLYLYTIQSSLVKSSTITTENRIMDIGALPNGVYIAKLEFNSKSQIKTIVVIKH